MTYLYNNTKTKNFRRDLRRNQTDAEKVLWHYIRAKQLNGHKFLRQYGVSSYILDFYCPKVRLAIELDGGQHNEPEGLERDKKRTGLLASQNITVLRFWNNDVLVNTDSVLEFINNELLRLTPTDIKSSDKSSSCVGGVSNTVKKITPPTPSYPKRGKSPRLQQVGVG